jgi:cytochrome P450
MLEHLLQVGRTDRIIEGIYQIAMNAQIAAQYDVFIPWKPDSTADTIQGDAPIAKDLKDIVPAFPITTLLPPWFLQQSFMPDVLRKVGAGVTNLPGHLVELLNTERDSLAQGHEPRGNFLSNMLVNSKAEKKAVSDDELVANLFLFTLASFDTTSNTMCYAVALLATYPEWQDWINEEMDQVLGTHKITDFEAVFPKLTRCLALMVSPMLLSKFVTA